MAYSDGSAVPDLDLIFTMDIVSSNAAPTATAPSAPSVTEEDTNVALANDIQVADTDADDQTLTFTITGGTLTIGTAGITFDSGSNGSSSFTAAGTLDAINTSLDAATFTPTANLSGTNAATISFTTNDGTVSSSAASVTFDITADITAPLLVSNSPLDNATNVTLGENIILNFDDNMVAGTGNITIRYSGDDTAFEQIAIGDAKINISSNQVTINPASTLARGIAYYIEIDATALDDDSSNSFAGISGNSTLNFTAVDVVINEVVTDPQQDWSTNGFNGTIDAGAISSGTDEWIELLINSDGIDLTGWTLELLDGSGIGGDLSNTGAFDVSNYLGSGSFANTVSGDYLVLGDVDGAGEMNNSGLTINLKDPGGAIVDAVVIGGVGQAPSGNAADIYSETVQRYTNGLDTDVDSDDFTIGIASMGSANTGPSVTLSVSSAIAEASGVSTITATLSAATSQNVTVTLAVDGSSTAVPADYTLSSSSIVITAGSTTGTATITATQDLKDENNETVIVNITGVTNGNENGTQQETVTISDDDATPMLAFNATSSNGSETLGSADLQVDLSAASGLTVTVDYTVTGTATGADYTLADGTLIMTAGDVNDNITIASIVNDLLDENNETVIVSLSSPTNASLGTNTVHTYTINDNDATPTLAFNASSSNGSETLGSADLQVDLSAASGLTVTVDYTVTGTATGADYILADGTLTMTAGDANKNITIASIVNDLLDENNETVIVTLSNPTSATLGTNTVHTYTINDNDATPTLAFNATSSNGSETLGSADLQVDLSAASGLTVTVDYTVTGTATGADYTLADGTLTMTAGDVNDNITIASIVNDLLDENNETVIVSLSSPTNASLGTNTVHTYTINDNDATPTAAFNASSSNGSETLGSADLQVDLSAASGLTVTVDYTVTGTATGADYTLADGTLTMTAGDVNDNITIASIVNDLLDENNETVILTLSSPTNASLGTNTVHTYTINDNDATPTLAFNASSSNGSETLGSADLQVDLSAASGLTVTVDYTVTGTATGADYTLADGTLTMTAGDANKNITIASIVNDLLDENNETVIVSLSSPTNASLGTNTVHTYTINDNDATPTLAFNATSSNGSETLGSADLQVDLSAASGLTVTVDYTVTGTATGADYTLADGTLTMTAGDVNDNITIASIVNDLLDENNETVILTLSNPTNATLGTNTVHTYTINDNDAPLTIIITSSSPDNVNGAFTVAFTLSESSSDFAISDVAVSGGTLSNFTGSGSSYSATVTPSAEGAVTVDVAADSISDAAGNLNTAATQLSRTYDATLPRPVITSSANAITNTDFVADIDFGEAVTGFALDKISVVNASLSKLAHQGEGRYQVTVTPDSDGTVSINIAAGTATDSAGNSNLAAEQYSLEFDGSRPYIQSLAPVDDAGNVQRNVSLLMVFNEVIVAGEGSISIYDADDSLLETISLSSVQVVIDGARVAIDLVTTFTPTHSYYVHISSDALFDTAGNAFTGIDDTTSYNFTIINNVPEVADDIASVAEDNSVAIVVLDNDSDSDSEINLASVTVTTQPNNGSTSVNTGTGVVTFTPNDDYAGTDSFTYQVEDVYRGLSGTATVTVTVTAVDDDPVAIADVGSTDEDQSILIDVLANDTDPDEGDSTDSDTLTIVSQPEQGVATVEDGQIRYAPETDFTGSDTFSYTVRDSSGRLSNTAEVIINITGVNAAPVTVADDAVTDEETAVDILVVSNDSDIDGSVDIATVAIVNQPGNGTVTVSELGVVTYTAEANFNGVDSFTYVVQDNEGATSELTTVSLTVNSVNDAPVASDDIATLLEDSTHSINVLGNDDDTDGQLDSSSVVVTSQPEQGSVSVADSGAILFTPDGNFSGEDRFTYQVRDDLGMISNTATVTLTVQSVNDAPLANDDSARMKEDSAITINVIANDNDVDGSLDTTTLTVGTAPGNGSLRYNGDGTFTYTPDENSQGSDSFSYTISDNEGEASNTATVTVDIEAVNDNPTLSGVPATDVAQGESYSFTPEASDVDGDDLTFSVSNKPAWTEFDVSSGTLSGSPGNDDVGTTSNIVIKVSDGIETISLASFNLEVVNVNDTPVVKDETLDEEYSEQNRFEIDVLENDSDIDGDTLTIIAASASIGEVIINDDKLTYQAPAGFTGNVELQYLVSDGNGEIVQATVTLVIEGEVELSIPILTVPDDIEVNATALFTKVDLGVATARDSNGKALPVSLVDNQLFFAPGQHIAYWRTEDAQGNIAKASQKVTVYPMVSIVKDDETTEGTRHSVKVYLNGQSPVYPVVIPYSVSGKADQYDHDLLDGNVTIEHGTVGEIEFNIVQDAENEGDEELTITLDPNLNLGSKTEFTLWIIERNIAPKVTTMIVQQGESRQIIVNNDEEVTISAKVTDANIGDSHQYEWKRNGQVIGNGSNYSFSPAQLSPGIYHVNLTVTDDASESLSVSKDIYIEVVDELALLGSEDTDGDLVPDNEEGFSDGDNDGIPDYQDAISECNVIQEQVSEPDWYLVEGEPGVCLRKGVTVASNETGGTHLLENEVSEQLKVDQEYENIGGVFDFVAYGLPQAGQSYKVVFPQRLPVPANAVYRKFKDLGWSDFESDPNPDSDSLNYLSSTQGEPGYCPPPGDESWVIGLKQGHWCVQLTIQDGGPNDDDGAINGSIIDPGGVAVRASDNVPPVAQNDTVTMSWNSAITIDVLANDSDADGNILDIVYAMANFGIVDIVNNQLYYMAKDQYYGVAKVKYCITDNSGGGSCADVTINVVDSLPSSAVDSLPSSVVVENSAGGGIGGATLFLLTLLSITRSYSRKQGLALLLFISFSSQANWYIESDLGHSIARDSAELGADKITNIDDTDFYWTVGLGYSINSEWDVTARYIDQGQGSASIIGNTATPDEYHQSIARVTPVLASGVGVDVRYFVWQADAYNFAVSAGAMYWETDFDSVYQGNILHYSDDGIDPYLGVELGYDINAQWAIGLGVTRYFIEANDVDAFSLKLKYRMNIEKD
ncbi:tandem-95 repeat protein [Photobacterium sagamiensis]|uniref:tandem-95 repeat protein n=1 Tax=Photobacterium sagamiensis TaxID=2910241 RepID=UPI003D10B107